MILGRMVGTVWATTKSPRLGTLKMAIVRPYFWYNSSHDTDHIIAVDQVGAEEGQDVLVCIGLPGRWQAGDTRTPVEASVMAIVDEVKIAEESLTDPQARFALKEHFTPRTLQLVGGGYMGEDRG